jgi:multidrug efflux system outer membrane protein
MIKRIEMKHLIMILFVILLYGCMPSKKTTDIQLPEIPAQYKSQTDTTCSGTLSYQLFFQDKLLVQLIDTAIANNYDLQTAIQKIKMAEADVLVTKGALRPRVDASLVSALRRFGLYTMDGAGNSSTFMLPGLIVPTDLPDFFIGFQSSWEVDLWGKLKNRKSAALARFLATTEGKKMVQTQLISDIANAYYELQSGDIELKIIDETITIQKRAYDIVKAKKEAAILNELAVKQFEAQLAGLLALRKEILQQILATENRINFLTGRFPKSVSRDTLYYSNQLGSTIRSGIPSQLLENRPDIRKASLELRAAKADIAAARAAFLPSFNITGSLGYQGFRPDLLFRTPESMAYTLVGGLAAPFINRAGIKAAFAYASAAQQESIYAYGKTVMNAYHEVYTELQRSENLEEVYQQKLKETNILLQSVEIAEDLFRTGRATYLEVLFAQQQMLKARVEMVEVKQRLLSTGVNLYKALGGGWR